MPPARNVGPLAQKLPKGTKSSQRKRKQEPEEDAAALSDSSKPSKRVKGEALRSLSDSPRQRIRSRCGSQEVALKNRTSDSEVEADKDKPAIATHKASKTRSRVKLGDRLPLDEELSSVSSKQPGRPKAKIEVVESAAVAINDESIAFPKRKIKSPNYVTHIVGLEEFGQVNEEAAPKKATRKRIPKVQTEAESTSKFLREETGSPSKKKNKTKNKATEAAKPDDDEQLDAEVPRKIRRKRKTKEEKEAEAMPLAARTAGLRMFIGAHVSIATGVEKAVTNCVHIGGNAFALFLQSQRKWDNKPLLEENRLAFMSMCEEHKYNASDHVLPHGSYLVNLAQEGTDRAQQAYDHFLGDLKRCEALGIKMYNFHPGAAGKAPLPEAINRIAAQLNRALAETQTAMPVLENMCGSGSVIGSRFSDLRDIIAGIKPEYKSRIGVCIDTCHAFAAGYDLRRPAAFQKTMQEFDDVVAMKYLKALHINDSKAPFRSHRDLHQNIGLGFLGLRAFHNVMNEPRFHNMPLILETPCERIDPSDPAGKKTIDDKGIWAREIKLLEGLIGMDPDGDDFKKLELELSEKGRASREKMQKAVDEKNEKAKKKLERGQKKLLEMMGKKKRESPESSILSDEEDMSE